ncbi:MAG: hypothetical protein LBM75_06800 [Myxococcales bacterium]|jgi:hypothetical protein|nr:hypothetical protein [Myxococcales bacterium]
MSALLHRATLLLAFALPFTAQAETWPETFSPSAMTSYLGRADTTVLLVAGGMPSEELASATAAFAEAAREAGVTVLTGEALGSVAELDDAAIAAKGAQFPADSIVIVRIFPGASSTPPTAMVTRYSKKGEPLDAFTVKRGVALAAKEGAAAPSDGAPPAAMQAISEIQQTGTSALDEYEKNFIGFQGWTAIGVNQYGQVVSASSGVIPVKGKFKEPLKGATFYEEIGRADLVSSYKTRRGAKIGLMAGGSVAMAGGLVVMLLPLFGSDGKEPEDWGSQEWEDWDAKQSKRKTNFLIAGGVITAVGTAALMTGLFLRMAPIDAAEARRLADEHNKKLRQKLGLPDNVTIDLSFSAGPGGGGALLSGTF